MTTFQKSPLFIHYVYTKKVDLSADTIKVLLTNVAPGSASKYADISANELAAGNGYTTGGATVAGTGTTNSGGTETFAAGATTFTSSGGNMGPFRYAVYYDSTAVDQPLIGYYDYGAAITLNGSAQEAFVVNPGGSLSSTN